MAVLSLKDFSAFLGAAAAATEMRQSYIAQHAAEMIQAEAKRVIGTYDYGWPALAPATVDDRVAKGYAPDEPLLRTGEMRDSIIIYREDPTHYYVGSDDPVARDQEMGTSTIPARSFLAGAAEHERAAIRAMASRVTAGVMLKRDPDDDL